MSAGQEGEELWVWGLPAPGNPWMACPDPVPLHLSSQLLLMFLPELASSGWPKHQHEFHYENKRLLVLLVLPCSFGPAMLPGEKTPLMAAVVYEHACVAVRVCSQLTHRHTRGVCFGTESWVQHLQWQLTYVKML